MTYANHTNSTITIMSRIQSVIENSANNSVHLNGTPGEGVRSRAKAVSAIQSKG